MKNGCRLVRVRRLRREWGEGVMRISEGVVLVVAFAFSLLFMAAPPASAEESVGSADSELALLTGYGITHRGFGDTRTQVQTVDLIGRYGWFLSKEIGAGSWFQGRHELLVELPLHLVVDPKSAVITAGTCWGVGSSPLSVPGSPTSLPGAASSIPTWISLPWGAVSTSPIRAGSVSSISSGPIWPSWGSIATCISPTPAPPLPMNR